MADDIREVRLDAVPSLGPLYAQAIGRMAQAVMSTRQATDLPAVRYTAGDVVADREQLAAYQQLLGEPGIDVLPAGYVHVLAFPVAVALMARADFPLPLMGMVHLANDVTQHAPLRLADSLEVRAWAQGLRLHRAGTQVELVTEVSRDGHVRWRGVSTYLAKGKRLPAAAPAEESARTDVVLPPVTGQWRLRADVGRRYATVSGDRNPIHTSPLTAKLFGFPRAIAHGMYTASRALATVGSARGDAFRWRVEFGKPVLLPGTVTFGLEPIAGRHSYAGWDSGSGKPYFTGSVTAL